ncbi:hypothetical protein BHE74_00003178, partial [Ensete ventricosum]
VVYPTLRVQLYKEEASDKQLRKNLYLLEEKWAEAHLRILAYKRAIARLYNHKVHPRHIGSGNLVFISCWRSTAR